MLKSKPVCCPNCRSSDSVSSFPIILVGFRDAPYALIAGGLVLTVAGLLTITFSTALLFCFLAVLPSVFTLTHKQICDRCDLEFCHTEKVAK